MGGVVVHDKHIKVRIEPLDSADRGQKYWRWIDRSDDSEAPLARLRQSRCCMIRPHCIIAHACASSEANSGLDSCWPIVSAFQRLTPTVPRKRFGDERHEDQHGDPEMRMASHDGKYLSRVSVHVRGALGARGVSGICKRERDMM